MDSKSGQKRRRWLRLLLAALAAMLLYQFSGFRTWSELLAVWEQENQLRQANESLREENTGIEAAIKELSPDGREVERIARQELGWAKPGEVVIKIPEKK